MSYSPLSPGPINRPIIARVNIGTLRRLREGEGEGGGGGYIMGNRQNKESISKVVKW